MKKIRMFVFLLVGIGFLISTGYGISTKKGWKNDIDLRAALKENKLVMAYSDVMEEESFLTPDIVDTFEKLFASADVIVRVCIPQEMERIMYTECSLSEAKVVEVYKGDVSAKTISIFEPIYVEDGLVRTVGAYHCIQDEQEYILFLKKIKCSLYNDDSYVYIPTTTSLSKYACNGNEVIGNVYLKEGNDEIEYQYSKVKRYDMATDKKEVIDQYKKNSKQIERLLKGEKIDEE